MAKIRFLTNNYIDDAYLTCTLASDTYNPITGFSTIQDISTLPVSNIKYISKARVLRTIDNTSSSINGILESELPITCFILNGHNLTDGTTIDINLYSDPFFTTLSNTLQHIVTTKECACNNTLTQTNLAIWTTPYNSIRSFRIYFTNTGSPSVDYFQLSKLFIGNYIETQVGVSKGYSLQWEDDTKQYRTEAGTLASDYIAPRKVFEFSLDTIVESERANLQRSLGKVGMQKEFFVSMFPEITSEQREIDYRGVVKLTKVPIYKEYANNIYNARYVLEEV